MPLGGAPFRKPKIEAAHVAAGLRALAVDAAADGRVDELAERWGVGAAKRLPGDPKRGGRNSARFGLDAEAEARRVVRAQGYNVTASSYSWSPADFTATRQPGAAGPIARHVQVKASHTFAAHALNDAVHAFLGTAGRKGYPVDVGITRECWLWWRGWAAIVVIAHDGTLSVSGPRAQEVERSLRGSLARAGAERRTTRTDGRGTFRERLGV